MRLLIIRQCHVLYWEILVFEESVEGIVVAWLSCMISGILVCSCLSTSSLKYTFVNEKWVLI